MLNKAECHSVIQQATPAELHIQDLGMRSTVGGPPGWKQSPNPFPSCLLSLTLSLQHIVTKQQLQGASRGAGAGSLGPLGMASEGWEQVEEPAAGEVSLLGCKGEQGHKHSHPVASLLLAWVGSS